MTKYNFHALYSKNRNAYDRMRYQTIPEVRQTILVATREYQKNHPEVAKKCYMKFHQKNLEIFRKYDCAKGYNRRHGIPSPHLRNEVWNGSKKKVARQSNGQFISWKTNSSEQVIEREEDD
jgi:hypothetical protein